MSISRDHYNNIEVGGVRYGYAFIQLENLLSVRIMEEVVSNMIDMNYDEEDERRLTRSDYMAKITANGHKEIGLISGNAFTADVEWTKGRSKLSIIVMDLSEVPRGRMN